MRSQRAVLLGGVAVAVVVYAGWAGWSQAAGMPEPTVEYSADQSMGAEGQTVHSRVYHAPGKQRMEMEQGGMKQVVITRFDRKVFWMLMVGEKMYMETRLEEGKGETRDIRECAIAQKPAGRDLVNGVNTSRSEIEASCPDRSKFSGTMWTTSEGIMMKLEAVAKEGSGRGSRIQIELKNLKIGRQDPGLFEVPPGYTKFAMPSGMPPMQGGVDTRGMMKAPPTPEPRVDQPRDTGRAYTAQPRETGVLDTIDKTLDIGSKLKGLFGR